jgi:IclR family transcriptional regulator, blcABC operon repressor
LNYGAKILSASSENPGNSDGASLSRSGDSVPALRRTVLILDLVAAAERPLNAAEITRSLGLPKSTVHGLLTVMMELNLLVRNPDGAFRLGPHPMRWTNAFLAEMDVLSVFNEYFAKDTVLKPYTMTLTVLDRDDVVYIGCRNSNQPLGQTFRIGMRLPAPFTATGKMFLSEMPDKELRVLFNSSFPAPMTSRSVRNLDQLMGELAITRDRGYSIDDGQVREAMICIGSAVRDHSGKMIAGIATSLLRIEASDDVLSDMAKEVQRAANALSRNLGASVAS